EAASRQLLARARENVAEERRDLETSTGEHRRLLHAFVQASTAGEQQPLIDLLAEDASLVVDVGPAGGRVGRIRNVGHPVEGARKIAAFATAVSRADTRPRDIRECLLNREPAIVLFAEGRPYAAVLI